MIKCFYNYYTSFKWDDPYKLCFKKALKAVTTFCVAASCFVGCHNSDNTVSVPENSGPLYIPTYSLPSQEQTTYRLLELFKEEQNFYLLNNNIIARFPCPTEN